MGWSPPENNVGTLVRGDAYCRISNCSSPYRDRDSPDGIYLSSALER
jgi:hypothetical protein